LAFLITDPWLVFVQLAGGGGGVLDISKLRLTQSSLAGSWPELGNI
jgi:hypothetical protein